ncbi:hypothetical protein CU098_009096 [Rhizopus stolonifer]|uniref:G-protein coupled receptors family 2 profile 2 domain-containing protein n=1 Tax=Rhizopus stolonifer TaxID=4846 RepID=A0A367JL41_RHIST|nr:hypothetical protein CU098_009096 [Rhizopus stolonifer]
MDTPGSTFRLLQPDSSELAAKIVSLLSFSLLSTLFGIKTYNVHFRYLTYSRWLVLALYVLSWTFTITSMLLMTTNNNNYISCFLSIMVCDIFYAGTKITIYAWLIEKIYVVSSIRQTRWRSKAYRFHACLMLPYIAIFTLMLVFHTAEIEESGVCIIGLQNVASLPLLSINLYMTIFFIRPLAKLGSSAKIGWRASRLNEVALRTLMASLVCLIVSFANIFALIMFKGRERGLVCLTCCTVDVTINVITVHWVTSQTPGKRMKDTGVDVSSHHQPDTNEEEHVFHSNHSDIDLRVAQQINRMVDENLYGFTTTNFHHFDSDFKAAPPYSPPTNNKKEADVRPNDDQASADSHFCNSSIHESQCSRKSLTKQS